METNRPYNSFEFCGIVDVDGIAYDVAADFNWETESVDHEFNPSFGMGRDLMAQVAQSVAAIRVLENETEKEVSDPALLERIKEATLQQWERLGLATQATKWGRWM